jgi:hypothetical protein
MHFLVRPALVLVFAVSGATAASAHIAPPPVAHLTSCVQFRIAIKHVRGYIRCTKRHPHHHAVATPAPAPSGGLGDVPGVPYWFASCVALRESTDGAGSPNIYGILPSNGYYAGMSIAAQKLLFAAMYARDGTAPWAPYDGC